MQRPFQAQKYAEYHTQFFLQVISTDNMNINETGN